MSIRIKMLLYFSTVVISTAVLLTVMAINSSNRILYEEIESELNSLVDQKLKNLYWYIDSKENDVKDMASLKIIEESLTNFSVSFYKGVNNSEYLIDNKKYHPYLNDLKNRMHAYDIFLINQNGDIIYTALHEPDFTTNINSGQYKHTQLQRVFESATTLLETKISEFSRYSPSIVTGDQKQSAFIAAPVFNGDELLGVVAIQLKSDDHYYLTRDYTGIKSTGEVVISKLDKGDALIIAPIRRDPDAAFNKRYEIGSDIALPIQWSVLGKNGSGISVGYEGTEIFAAWRYIPEIQWGVVVKIETKEVFSSVKRLTDALLLAGIFITSLVLMFALYISRKLTSPLLELVEATKRTTKGDLDQTIKVTSNDELGELTHSFNLMLEARKNSESILAKSSSKLSLIIESTNAGIWEWDLETGETVLNERWAEMIGYSLSQLQPVSVNSWEKLSHPDDLIIAQEAIFNHWKKKTERFSCEIRVKHKKGHWVWILDIGMVVEWDVSGKPKRMLGIHLDISDTKKNEEVLRLAKEQAEAGAKSKSEFLASMSHEIRTPMNGVLGMLSLLQKEPLSIEQTRKVSTAKNSAESLLTLINDILDFSKIEAGKVDLEIISFNVNLLLSDLVHMLVFKAEEKGIELLLDTEDVEQALVKGDPGRVRQIITNLVGNAIKFTSEGEVVIKVSCKETQPGKSTFYCEVMDTGIGIDERHQKSLFEKFTQADASTTREYGGTGLGLSISKSLCELMHGDISMTSELGVGSCFVFSLPLDTSTDIGVKESSIDLQGMKILTLVKNDKTRDIIQRQLSQYHAVVSSLDFDGASFDDLSLKNQVGYDVVIVDIALLGADHNRVAQSIRHALEDQSIKLVLMSSVKAAKTEQDIKGLGFDAYFNKPATPRELLSSLAELFKDCDKFPCLSQAYFNAQPHINDQTNTLWPHKTRILLVEDNQINQMVAQALLQEMGLDADIAADGQEAIRHLKESIFDPYTLILMDCQMPIMDGYTATELIRRGEAGNLYASIPIIAMTANAMRGDREKCLQAGMNEYLTKPVDEKALRLMLEHFIFEH